MSEKISLDSSVWGLKSRPDISHARLPFLTVNPLVYFQFSF